MIKMTKNQKRKNRKIIAYLIVYIAILSTNLIMNRISIADEESLEKLIEQWKLVAKQRLEFKYTPTFDPFKKIEHKLKPAPITQNITVYHRNYDLHELRLVGIVHFKNKKIAIIEDPQGRGFFLKTGDYIGKKASVITKITNCAVYIAERYINEEGKIITSKRKHIMYLTLEGKKCSE